MNDTAPRSSIHKRHAPVRTHIGEDNGVRRSVSHTGNGPFDDPSPTPTTDTNTCWAWLEPTRDSRSALPYVMLRGNAVGIGRGPNAFELCLHLTTTPLASQQQQPQHAPQEVPSLFVEIPDGRVSRMHCLIFKTTTAPTLQDVSRNGTFLNTRKLSRGEKVCLQDGDRISLVLSVSPLSEQAFIFHEGHPLSVLLQGPPRNWVGWNGFRECCWVGNNSAAGGGGSRVFSPSSSCTPNVPYHDEEDDDGEEKTSFKQTLTSPSSTNGSSSGSSSTIAAFDQHQQATTTTMKRSATSLYTTPQVALEEPSTLHCQICLQIFKNAVALEPCGHCYCSRCLSHYVAAALNRGHPLNCPLRCPNPQRVVANVALRQLVDEFNAGRHDDKDDDDKDKDGGKTPHALLMHPTVIVDDWRLPLPFHRLKEDQIILKLTQLSVVIGSGSGSRSSNQGDAQRLQQQRQEIVDIAELLTRWTWNDEVARTTVLSHGGIPTLIAALSLAPPLSDENVFCACCLALMSSIRGEGRGSEGRRWEVGRAGGVGVLISAMRHHRDHAIVQLSALLFLIALEMEGSYFRRKIIESGGVEVVLNAARRHVDCEDVVAKALEAAGSLVQEQRHVGEGEGGRDVRVAVEKEGKRGEQNTGVGVEELLIEAGAVEVVVMVLKRYRGTSKNVLWASLPLLVALTRYPSATTCGEDNDVDRCYDVWHARIERMAGAGVLVPLRIATREYQQRRRCPHGGTGDTIEGSDGDEAAIVLAAEFLESLLERALALVWAKRVKRVAQVASVGAALWLGYKTFGIARGNNRSSRMFSLRPGSLLW